jgi:curli production assembly/transport component CsgG
MATLQKLPYLLVLLLSSCAIVDVQEDTYAQRFPSKGLSEASIFSLQSEELKNIQKPQVQPVVAVYGSAFTDQTGQRKSNSEFALFSTAITQQPSTLLIRALKHASNGEFFRVVERVGLDNLVKERQLIRSAREQFAEKEEDKNVPPLLFAGVLLEGSVISYDTNLKSGGSGARFLGVSGSVQYREDTVSVSLRMVSVATGEILIEVLSQKTIYSYGRSNDVFKFYESGTELVELEIGSARNESTTIALMKSIEAAVVELIKVGYDRRFWAHEQIEIEKPCDDDDAECIANIRG